MATNEPRRVAPRPRRVRPDVTVHPFVYWGPPALTVLGTVVVALVMWSTAGTFPTWLLLLVFVYVLYRLIAATHDVMRIEEYLLSRGQFLVAIDYSPFGPGWLGTRNVIYAILYLDQDGAYYTASCSTSYFSGVYLSQEGRVAGPGRAVTFRGRTYGPNT